jgi:Protein of unknown function (DUF3987)
MTTTTATRPDRDTTAKPVKHGPASGVCFVCVDLDLAEKLRSVAFRALCYYTHGSEGLKTDLERRSVVVIHLGAQSLTQAALAAENIQNRYWPERVGTLDLTTMRFDGDPNDFVAWWTSELEGNYESGADFVQEAQTRTKWLRKASDRPSEADGLEAAEAETEIVDRWPKIRPEAFHGLAGEIVRLCDPETEADPAAVLLQFLTGFGNMVGRRPHFVVNATRHYLNLFVAMVGPTATGRKGTSWDVARHALAMIDQEWVKDRVTGGLVSGEGLIHHVRDAVIEPKSVKDPQTKQMTKVMVEVDAGVPDKRLLVIETEMSRVLKGMNRDSNTLSDVLRQCWDSGNLGTLNRKDPAKATGAHISVVAHVTPADVRKHLSETDSANGFANRFLWTGVRRSKLLPEGGDVLSLDWSDIRYRLAEAVTFARDTTGTDWTSNDSGGCGRRMKRDPAARTAWNAIYEDLSAGKPGLLGKVLSRAEAQVMRLACLYALLDCSADVRPEHLVAALAVWHYCVDSARFVFGDGMGDPDAEKLLGALKDADDGLTRTQITVDVFGKNKKSAEIAALLSELLNQGLVHRATPPRERGRRTETWFHGGVRTNAA